MDKIKMEKTVRGRRLLKKIRDVKKAEENPVSAMEFCGAVSNEFPTFDVIHSSRTINTISCLCHKSIL